MSAPLDLRRRLARLEAAPPRARDLLDYSDAELIDCLGLADEWPTMTEAERDEALGAIAREVRA
jgi:hypothetical protein